MAWIQRLQRKGGSASSSAIAPMRVGRHRCGGLVIECNDVPHALLPRRIDHGGGENVEDSSARRDDDVRALW